MNKNIIPIRPAAGPGAGPVRSGSHVKSKGPSQVAFHRTELALILGLYGHMVSKGDWKDYAMDFLRDRAEFSIYRRATETPLYRIIKTPAMANRQGAWSVVAPGGLILKRGHDLKTVLRVFDKQKLRVTK